MDGNARLHARDIVCVGFADWDSELWTNQQHLMSRMARDNRVLFIESLGLRQPRLAGRDMLRIARRVARGLAAPRQLDAVHVLSPLVLPFHRFGLVRQINRRLLAFRVAAAAAKLGLQAPILWGYVPQAEILLDTLDPALVVYHCVDNIAAQPGIDASSFLAAERRFAARADLVIASSAVLAERMRTLSGNVMEAQNVADTALFAKALAAGPIDAAIAMLPAPRAVFTGAIVATKLDIVLITELARRRRDWSFAFVGPVGPGDPRTDVSALRREPNVHLLGPRRYDELPSVLRGVNAGLIPYARNALTDGIFPMKVYEYLAAGLPVLATPLRPLVGVPDVSIAADAEEMSAQLDRVRGEDDADARAARSTRAQRHSWDQRLQEITAALTSLAPDRAER